MASRSFVGLLFVSVVSGCAHRELFVSGPELERASVELASRGEARVMTEEGVRTNIRGDETARTTSGPIRVDRWIGTNCEPTGGCHFDGNGILVKRIDPGASTRTALEIVGGGLALGAVGAGVGCAVGMICDSDAARTTGTIILGTMGVLLVGGSILWFSCKSCWAWR